MSATRSASTDVPYGVARVCECWEIPRSSFYFWQKQERLPFEERPVPKKRGPKTALSDEELAEKIRELLERVEREAGFRGEGYRKVHARLCFEGVRVGRERVLRVMREHGLQAPVRLRHARGPQVHDGTITTELPDEMWGTDATTTLTVEEGNAWIFICVDHCTSECIGIHAARPGTRFEALEPIRQGVREHFGGELAEDVASGLALRHDHGSQYISDVFQGEIRFLGMESSPSFVATPEGNGVSERFIRTLKGKRPELERSVALRVGGWRVEIERWRARSWRGTTRSFWQSRRRAG